METAKAGSSKKPPADIIDEYRDYDDYVMKNMNDAELARMYNDLLSTELGIQEYLENAIVGKMEADIAAMKSFNAQLEAKATYAEAVADTLSGYTSPVETNPENLSLSLLDQGTLANQGLVHTPGVADQLYGGGYTGTGDMVYHEFGYIMGDERLFRPGDFQYLGAPPKYSFGSGAGHVAPTPYYTAAQFETVKIDPDTGRFQSNKCKPGSPSNGCMRSDGMIYSEDYGNFVSNDLFSFEKGLQDKWEQDKAAMAAEREKSWEEYWKEHSDPTFDEQLKNASREVWEAKQSIKESEEKIRLYDNVLPQIEDRVKKLNEKTNLLSKEQIIAMSRSIIKAISKGASEQDLKDIAKKYIKMGMDAAEAEAAEQEEAEAYAQLKTDVAHTILSINSIVNPVSGTVLEIGASAYEGYAEGGVKGALWTTAKYTLPVNAAEALYNGKSYKEVFLALLQDAGNIAQLKGGLSALKGNKTGVADKLDDIGVPPTTRGERGASGWLEKCVSNPTACMEKSKVQTDRSKAWIAGRTKAKETVGDFRKIVKSSNPDDIKKAVVNIQKDKHALQMINEADDATKIAFKNELNKIYDKTDDAVSKHFTDKYAKKYGDKFVEVEIVKATNPSTKVKVSYDRDVTVRIKTMENGKLVVRDVPARELENVYNPAFYEAAGGQKTTGYKPGEINNFASDMDQACVDRLHPEAYGSGPADLDVALNNPAGKFTDPEQIGQAMGYKANHWYEKANDLAGKGNFSQAEAALEEGMRQTTKQFDNQLVQRVQAANQKLAAAGKPAAKIPGDLQEAVDVMKRVGTGPGKGFTPAQAEQILETMGWTPKDVGYEMGKYIESLQKLSPV